MQIPFTSYRLVRARDVEQLLERMRINVPSSIRDSERTISERDRIIAEARAEHDRIIQDARHQASEMLSERSMVTTAQAEAERIIQEGKELARHRADEADQYAIEVLQDLSQRLQGLTHQVDNGIELMRENQESAQEPPAEQQERRPRNALRRQAQQNQPTQHSE